MTQGSRRIGTFYIFTLYAQRETQIGHRPLALFFVLSALKYRD
jgi:hypothetical protein